MLVQGTPQQDPFSGHLFAFHGRRADLIKIVFWNGSGLCLCLFTKRPEQRDFPWPVAEPTRRPAALELGVFGPITWPRCEGWTLTIGRSAEL